MKNAVALLLVALLAAAVPRAQAQGGTECAVCTALIGLFEQLAVIHPEPVIDIMEDYCRTLPEPPQSACITFVNTYGARRASTQRAACMDAHARTLAASRSFFFPRPPGPAIIEGFVARNTADMICRNIGICTDPTCNLFPLPAAHVKSVPWAGRDAVAASGYKFAPCDQPIISEWCKSLEDFIEIHTPLFDADRDRHSAFPTLRGATSDRRGPERRRRSAGLTSDARAPSARSCLILCRFALAWQGLRRDPQRRVPRPSPRARGPGDRPRLQRHRRRGRGAGARLRRRASSPRSHVRALIVAAHRTAPRWRDPHRTGRRLVRSPLLRQREHRGPGVPGRLGDRAL